MNPLAWVMDALGLLPRGRSEPAGPLVKVAPSAPKERQWGLRRKKWMRRVNPERRRRLSQEAFGPQSRVCRLEPCCICGALPPSEPHHWITRGAGGRDEATVPVCRRDHDLADGKSELRGVSFAVVASYMADKVRVHVCDEHVEPDPDTAGAARCYVCRAALDPNGVTP